MCCVNITSFEITPSDLTNCSSADQQQGEMAAVESGGGFSQKRNTNSQVGYPDLPCFTKSDDCLPRNINRSCY